MDIKNYYLDLVKVQSLTDEQQKQINTYYFDMLHMSSDSLKNSMVISLFNTLYQNGYLKEVRSEKIDKLISS